LSNLRRGTRINRKIPIILTSLDLANPFSEEAVTLLVNPQGCAARFGRALEIGTTIRLDGLPVGRSVVARVVNCIKPEKYAKFWILGLTLDEPGNVWGIESPPADWHLEQSISA
jgi:hypothetical protein